MRWLVPSVLVLLMPAGVVDAHVSISSGRAQATKSQVITFSVGHGCQDANKKHLDTVKVRVAIPEGVTNVRALFSDFGRPKLTRNEDVVTHVEWTKPAGDLLDEDDSYYELKIRVAIPDVAFTKLKFEVQQTCEDSTTHEQVVVDWNAPEDSTTADPAPFLTVAPARTAGWNKITMPRAITQDEMPIYFGDAQIVWRGNAAFSPSGATADLITTTQGVSALTNGLQANDEIWVKY
ncbi:MAG: DUF1775 domain-containing protein [Kofleriaceae bacterium]